MPGGLENKNWPLFARERLVPSEARPKNGTAEGQYPLPHPKNLLAKSNFWSLLSLDIFDLCNFCLPISIHFNIF
jgi:hypothetical protein